MTDTMTMIVRTFVPIMERAGFQQVGREPAEAIELDDEEQLALIDTLIRRLHMRTGGEAPALPIGIEDEPADRREWFGIVVQSCGEAGVFFQRIAQGEVRPKKKGPTISEFFAAHPDKLEIFTAEMRAMTAELGSALNVLKVKVTGIEPAPSTLPQE